MLAALGTFKAALGGRKLLTTVFAVNVSTTGEGKDQVRLCHSQRPVCRGNGDVVVVLEGAVAFIAMEPGNGQLVAILRLSSHFDIRVIGRVPK